MRSIGVGSGDRASKGRHGLHVQLPSLFKFLFRVNIVLIDHLVNNVSSNRLLRPK